VATKKSKATHGKRLKVPKKLEQKWSLTSLSSISVSRPTDATSPN